MFSLDFLPAEDSFSTMLKTAVQPVTMRIQWFKLD